MALLKSLDTVAPLKKMSNRPHEIRSARIGEMKQKLADGRVGRWYKEIDVAIGRIEKRDNSSFFYRIQFQVSMTQWPVLHASRGLEFELRRGNSVIEKWHHPLAWISKLNQWFPKSMEGNLDARDYGIADNVRVILLAEEVS